MFLASKHHSYMLCKNTKFQLIVGSYRLLDKGQPGGMHPLPPTRFSVLVKLLARKDMEVSVSHILNL